MSLTISNNSASSICDLLISKSIITQDALIKQKKAVRIQVKRYEYIA